MQYSTAKIEREISVNGIEFNKGSIYDRLCRLTDLRGVNGRRYRLETVLMIVIMAKLCGEDTPTAIAEWAKHRQAELVKLLGLSRPTLPSHHTYRRILAYQVYAEEVERLVGEYNQDGEHGEVYALDGKALRGMRKKDEEGNTYLLTMSSMSSVLRETSSSRRSSGPSTAFGSDLQDNMIETPHTEDTRRKVPIFSLYSETREPTQEMLDLIDVLVIDIQDVGARIYTFIYTMANCLRAAARKGLPVIVCDRPNPIGGVAIEGPMLEKNFESFVGQFPISMRHGMTLAELARLFNEHHGIGAALDHTLVEQHLDQLFHVELVPLGALDDHLAQRVGDGLHFLQALETTGLNVYYGDFRAVKDINLQIQRQRITAIIGPSGCGKSTVLRAFNRMNELVPSARATGQVLLHGKNIYDADVDPVQVAQTSRDGFPETKSLPKIDL